MTLNNRQDQFKKDNYFMKKDILHSIGILLLDLVLVFSCASCSYSAFNFAFNCEFFDDGNHIFERDPNDPAVTRDTITINGTEYNVRYTSSVKSVLTNELFDIYEVVDDTSDPGSTITVRATTGEITSFTNITPYSDIADSSGLSMNELSDEDIKRLAEQALGETVDFSSYNTFSLIRPISTSSTYHLVWQVKKDMLCNNSIDIHINSEGTIKGFRKTDACPENLTTSFISTAERDRLLEEEIKKNMGRDSPDGVTYEIESEILSLYNNSPAILYTVSIHGDGFVQLICLAIHK